MTYKALIIDDEQRARKTLSTMLSLYCPELIVDGMAADVRSGLTLIQNSSPDIVFLDVEMPDGTGFDLLDELSIIPFKIIFVSAYNQYALQAFKVNAIDYILKPASPDELVAAINKCLKQIKLETQEQEETQLPSPEVLRNRLILRTSDSIHIVRISDIIHCEATRNYTTFFLMDTPEKIIVSKTLKQFEDILSQYSFFRTHQSHLINLRYLRSIKKGHATQAIMADQSQIPVSIRKKDELIQLISNE